MSNCKNTNPCQKESCDILLMQIKREIKNLMVQFNSKELEQDAKINSMCVYIKDNLSSTLGDLLDEMQLSGELDDLITSTILSELDIINKKVEFLVNVKTFGVCGNGITDDTDNLQNAFDCSTDKTVFIPKGTYLISRPLIISNNINIKMDKECEIKAIQPMTNMIQYNSVNHQSSYSRSFNKFIEGGILNGDMLTSNSIMTLQGYLYFNISDVVFKNFRTTGLQTKLTGTNGNELVVSHCYFRNESESIQSLAIDNISHDAIFTDIIIRDSKYGIRTRGSSLFSKIHGWLAYKNLLPGSYFIKCLDYTNKISDCYSDTYQYSFISCFGTTFITNSLVLWNTDIYSQDIADSYKPVVYKSEQDDYGFNSYGTFRTFGNTIQSKFENISICDRQSVYNTFDDHISNYNNLVDKENLMVNSNVKGGFGGDLNTLFEAGCYGIDNNVNRPADSYRYGSVIVLPVTRRSKQYLTNSDISNLSYCTQIYLTTDLNPTMYIRNYLNNSWTNWVQFNS